MRTNVKTVTKSYDEDQVNDWSLKYEYESQDGAVPLEVKVTGTKAGGSLYYAKSGANVSVNFGGGASVDSVVIDSINTEIIAIQASFTEG